jgi:signal transduction histidine kinase
MAVLDRDSSGWPDLLRDVAPAVGLVALGALIGAYEQKQDLGAAVVVAAPLVARRLWPLAVLGVTALLVVLTADDVSNPVVQIAAVLVASFTTGERSTTRYRTALVVLLVAGAMSIGFAVQDADPVESLVVTFVVLVPSWLLGDIVRSRRVDAVEREDEAARALRESDERLRAAVAEERRQMARELHDVVAHGVSVMLIQAGAARQVLETSPEQAEGALLTVEATGREAMAELRRLLGVLNDDGEATGLAPQPGIDQLGALVGRVREAGLPAELAIDGTPRALPTSLDVTVYRIVQEALTNALRYARRAATLVRVTFDADQLRLEILDDGPTAAADAAEGSGRGLVGMQQRATQVGGRLEAGPRLGGGYAVRAWLPLAPDEP